MNWLHYLLEANIYLSVFYVAYCLLLNKETHYLLNRFYLVLSSIVSFILPVLQLGILLPPIPDPSNASYFVAEQVTNVPAPIAVPVQVTAPAFTLQDGLWYVYLTGAIVCAVLLTIKLVSLFKLIRTNKVIKKDNYNVVYLKDTNTAFSFFNYLFIGTEANNERTILRHELVHIRQKHSVDILFLEFLKIINWFNPMVYLLQNSLKTQHEYIADEQTVTEEADATSYSSFLVNNAYGLSGPAITHSFYNLNLLKNRIIMLHQQRSGNLARLKYLVAVPIGAALLCASTLGFSKTYGWIDLAPVHIAQQPKRVAPTPPMPPKQKVDENYYGWANFIEPTDDLKKMGLSLQKEGYKIKSRKIGSNQLYISIETLPHLGQHPSANATFNIDELKKLNHVIAIGGGSFGGEEKVFVQNVLKSDMKDNLLPSLLEPQKPKVDKVTFPDTIKWKSKKTTKLLPPPIPAGFKPQKTYINAKGYKIEEGIHKEHSLTMYIAVISDPSGKKINYENNVYNKFIVYKGMTDEEKIALDVYGYKFPDVKVSGMVRQKPKVDQVRFPPPIVKPGKTAPGVLKVADKRRYDVVKFPPPVVKPDKVVQELKVADYKGAPYFKAFDGLRRYLTKSVLYPKVAKEQNINKMVTATFSINAEGHITNPTISHNSGEFDETILKALNAYTDKIAVKADTYSMVFQFYVLKKNEHKFYPPEVLTPGLAGYIYIMTNGDI